MKRKRERGDYNKNRKFVKRRNHKK